jgi:hypothetical protein
MKASASDHQPPRLPFNIFGMPKVDLYMDLCEEPRKEIKSVAANRWFINKMFGEVEKPETPKPSYNKVYAFSMLICITLIRISMLWQQKSLSYFYGFSAVGESAGDPFFEISKTYPQLDSMFGLLVGAFYTLTFSISGLFAG